MVVRKAHVVPFECVVRGYLSGSGWKEYRASGTVCGIELPRAWSRATGSTPSSRRPPRPRPGHDENVSFETMAERDRRRGGRDVTIDEPGSLSERRGPCPATSRADPGRHQVRVGLRRADRRAPAGRRSAHARQLALLARDDVSPRRPAAVVRQAVRPRLARDDRLGQGEPAAARCPRTWWPGPATSTSRRTRA